MDTNRLRSLYKTLPRIGLILVGLIVLPLVALALCLALFETWRPRPNPPSDLDLIEHYMQHAVDFNQLATLLLAQDNHFVVFPDIEKCQVGEKLIDSRGDTNCAELVQYFKALNLGWAYAGNQPLWLNVYTWGLSVSGFEKGYVYSVEESWVQEWGNIVESTDEPCTMPCFQKIDTNWYIYVDD